MAGERGGTIGKPFVVVAGAVSSLLLLWAGVRLPRYFISVSGRGTSHPEASQAEQPCQTHVSFPWDVFQGTLIQAVRVHPPGRKPGWLMLTVEDPHHAQPRRSHLYLSEPGHPARVRPLALPTDLNVWDLSAGDIEGDGREEVGLCTYNDSTDDFHPCRRFFIYSWSANDNLSPRWRGSCLRGRYLWARLADVTGDGKAELVSVELTPSKGQVLTAYEWRKAAFRRLARSPQCQSISQVETWQDLDQHCSGVTACVDAGKGAVEVSLAVRHGQWRAVDLPSPQVKPQQVAN